ncbi:MAG: FAD-binding oxidoreductase [Anaerolineae bacterium]
MMSNPNLSPPREFVDFWNALRPHLQLGDVPPTPVALRPPRTVAFEEPLRQSLARLVGEDNVLCSPEVCRRYAGGKTYAGFIRRHTDDSSPLAIVRPKNEQVIAELMLWAGSRAIQLLPWGGGTDPYRGKSESGEGFITVCFDHLSEILNVDEEHQTLQVQAGAGWLEVEEVLNTRNLTTALVFPSPDATLGGRAACGAIGLKALEYGSLADHILGMRAITPAGLMVLEQPTPETSDPRCIMLGTYGRWGVITELSLRIFPRPAEKTHLIASFQRWDEAIDVLKSLMKQDLKLTTARIIPNQALSLFGIDISSKLLQIMRSMRSPSWEAHLILEIEGSREIVNATKNQIQRKLQERDVQITGNGKIPPANHTMQAQRQVLLKHLWHRGILAHVIAARVPWRKTTAFLSDWRESLNSVLRATSGKPGMTLTEIYASRDHAILETLLLGHQNREEPAALQEQLQSIQSVAQEIRKRWDVEREPAALLTQVREVMARTLDPQEVMMR